MEISRNTWHYRLLEKWISLNAFWDIPKNLCPYVQLLAFVLFLGVLTIMGVIGAGFDVYYFHELFADDRELWAAVTKQISLEHGFFLSILFTISCMLGCVVWIVVSIVALIVLVSGIHKIQEVGTKRYEATLPRDDWGDPIYPRKTYKQPKPNIFWEWMKAKHKKICPIIEFKDD